MLQLLAAKDRHGMGSKSSVNMSGFRTGATLQWAQYVMSGFLRFDVFITYNSDQKCKQCFVVSSALLIVSI